jgi:CheY-like chemotaxis protein
MMKKFFNKRKAELDNPDDTGSISSSDETNIKILIVDDENINRYVLKRYIMRLKKNVTIIEAVNGLDAIEKLSEHTISIIFIDIKMPVLNGVEASKRILKLYKDMIIIGVTGQVETESINLTLKIGMKKCIAKPVALQEVSDILTDFFPNVI